jgi:hypothetical protein
MAHRGAAEVELDSYQKLLAQVGELDDKRVIAIEPSPE